MSAPHFSFPWRVMCCFLSPCMLSRIWRMVVAWRGGGVGGFGRQEDRRCLYHAYICACQHAPVTTCLCTVYAPSSLYVCCARAACTPFLLPSCPTVSMLCYEVCVCCENVLCEGMPSIISLYMLYMYMSRSLLYSIYQIERKRAGKEKDGGGGGGLEEEKGLNS